MHIGIVYLETVLTRDGHLGPSIQSVAWEGGHRPVRYLRHHTNIWEKRVMDIFSFRRQSIVVVVKVNYKFSIIKHRSEATKLPTFATFDIHASLRDGRFSERTTLTDCLSCDVLVCASWAGFTKTARRDGASRTLRWKIGHYIHMLHKSIKKCNKFDYNFIRHTVTEFEIWTLTLNYTC